MNARLVTVPRLAAGLLAALAALVPLGTQASPPAPVTITVDCAQPRLPGQQAIARLTGVDNFARAYAVRTRLMVDTQRACQNPVGKVQLVVAPEPASRLAAR
ncbi:MAG TPA: hypothetical protein VGD42_20810 [Lysobacter sp.]